MVRHVRMSKHYQEWGRRPKGSAKARRSAVKGARGRRKVWWESSGDRCVKHHAGRCRECVRKAV